MKKILAIIVTVLCAKTVSANTTNTIPVYWPFSIGSIQVNAVRAVLESANSVQKEHNFVVVHRPGAGSAIAAKAVASSKRLELLAVSSSYFLRPVFYPGPESHAVNDLRPIAQLSTMHPGLLVSSRYKSLDEIRKQKRVTIGMNYGSFTQLTSLTLQRVLPGVEITLIPYHGTTEPTVDTVSGVLDMTIAFRNNLEPYDGKLNVLGVTGTRNIEGYRTFRDQGINEFDNITVEFWILAPSWISDQQARELHKLFVAHTKSGAPFWAKDAGIVVDLDFDATQRRFNQQIKYWKDLKETLVGK